MKNRSSLIVAIILIAWLTTALVRVENQRYAMSIGMCQLKDPLLWDIECLSKVETRTSWLWHVVFALKLL